MAQLLPPQKHILPTGNSSSSVHITCRILQGTILGPVLFLEEDYMKKALEHTDSWNLLKQCKDYSFNMTASSSTSCNVIAFKQALDLNSLLRL